MLKLGMIHEKRDDQGLLQMCPTEEWKALLVAKKHVPPTFGGEPIMSPTNGTLFVKMKCAQIL